MSINKNAIGKKFVGRGTAKEIGINCTGEKYTHRDDPEHYRASQELADAVNVSLILGMPLLLTGEPGTGKTQLADRIAFEFECGEVLRFETKSSTESRDLFYEFDLVGRLAAAQMKEDTNPLRFLSYNALGKAILLAQTKETITNILPIQRNQSNDGDQEARTEFTHDGPRRTVVLIDEVDKASRDFPNDLLNELEGNYFHVRELNNHKVKAPSDITPIIVITSNSEKQLPDPFLRRCVYHHIKFPDKQELYQIACARAGDLIDGDALLKDLVSFFVFLRNRLQRKPSTAELLRWVEVLHRQGINAKLGLSEQKNLVKSTVSILSKSPDDQTAFAHALDGWTQPNAFIIDR